MSNLIIDEELASQWNHIHGEDGIQREHFWELCRKLEASGVVEHDKSVISLHSIGPFRFAIEEPNRKSRALFFFEKICPFIFATTAGMSFGDAYGLLILPAISLLINLLDNFHFVKDELQWKILFYIKGENAQKRYPSRDDIYKFFPDSSRSDIDRAIVHLESSENALGEIRAVISINLEGRFNSLV